jgi:hypothetical protein
LSGLLEVKGRGIFPGPFAPEVPANSRQVLAAAFPESPTGNAGVLSDPADNKASFVRISNPPPGRVGYFRIQPTSERAYSRIPHPEGWGTFRSGLHQSRSMPRAIPYPEGWGTFRSGLHQSVRTPESPTRKGGVPSDPAKQQSRSVQIGSEDDCTTRYLMIALTPPG